LAWLVQSFITGCLAIVTLTAWGNLVARVRKPEDRETRMNLGLTAVWAHLGWVMWIALRVSSNAGSDAVLPFLLFSLITVIFTAPLVWHTVAMMAKPTRSIWIVVSFLGLAAALQCWCTMRIAEDPVYIVIVNSALIAVAVVIWLVAVSLPTRQEPSPRIA
jgi:hypothetical protein